MIRLAERKDIEKIAKTYESLFLFEESHGSSTNWKRGVYPTSKVPEEKVPQGVMYIIEENNEICASMVINKEQAQEYADIKWLYQADDKNVLVIHTLCIPPEKAGQGYGRQMVEFAKQYAKKNGCTVIRIDTYAQNENAKRLYQKNGFRIAGHGKMLLQGLIEEEQVYLECKI